MDTSYDLITRGQEIPERIANHRTQLSQWDPGYLYFQCESSYYSFMKQWLFPREKKL